MKTVLVQAGHAAPRDPNHLNETGTAGEIELVTAIRDELVRLLRLDKRFRVLSMPGLIPHGTKCDAALFLHADGSGNKTASGYSFGYPAYRVNGALAETIDREFQKIPGHPPHHRDNYTADMRGYYGFNRVDTAGPEVLVEHGFLTNPKEAAWLRSNVKTLAAAEHKALMRYFGMSVPKPKPPPAPVVKGAWQVTRTFHDGHQEEPVKTRSILYWALRHPRQVQRGVRAVKFGWLEEG